LAYLIYGHGLGQGAAAASFAADWKVSPEEWLKNVASQSFADADYLRPFAERYYDVWAGEVGLPVHLVEWHQPPKQALTFPGCDVWDCPALVLDAGSLLLSAVGDAALVGCTVATEGGCLVAVGLIKGTDFTVSSISLGYALYQWASGEASDLDLAVNLAGFISSILPIGGEVTGIASLSYDLVDPVIDDEQKWGPGSAR
jgi:hypothetical protein